MYVCMYMKICGFSKKKAIKKLYNKELVKHKLDKKDFKKKVKGIKKEDIYCVDEFGIKGNNCLDYGYSIKGKRLITHLKVKNMLIKESVMCIINSEKILKYEVHKKAINGEIYLKFMSNFLKENNVKGKYILMDNVSFHKTKGLRSLIEDSGNSILYIPPYSPEFNPIEEMFASLKLHIRSHLSPLHKNRNTGELIKKYILQNKPLIGYYNHSF
jgi:transposase